MNVPTSFFHLHCSSQLKRTERDPTCATAVVRHVTPSGVMRLMDVSSVKSFGIESKIRSFDVHIQRQKLRRAFLHKLSRENLTVLTVK